MPKNAINLQKKIQKITKNDKHYDENLKKNEITKAILELISIPVGIQLDYFSHSQHFHFSIT